MLPERKTARLRFGRLSAAGARYFVTFCVKDRQPVLAEPEWLRKSIESLLAIHRDADVQLLAATVMPDHAHALFELGDRLSVGRVLAKVKSLARNLGRAPWNWLEDGFERRLRPNEDTQDYGFYIFMNPYRAGLVGLDAAWLGWVCPDPKLFRFCEKMRADGLPQPEWLVAVDEVAKRIVAGE